MMEKAGRQANYELLRIIAMWMVITLHYLNHTGMLPAAGEDMVLSRAAALLIESFCIIAVNLYVMISGYFLSLSDFDKNLLLEEEVLLDKVLDIMKDYHFLNTLPELLLYKSKIAFMSNNSKWKEFFKEGHYIGTFVYSEEQITRCEKMIMDEAYELIGSIG